MLRLFSFLLLQTGSNSFLTRGTAARRIAADDPGKSETPKVETESVMIILAHQFGVNLAHAIDGSRALYSDVGRRISWRIGSESSDCRRNENPKIVLLGELHDVVHASIFERVAL